MSDEALKMIAMIGPSMIVGICAIGSGVGICIAGSAAVGAWKRCYKANKPAPMSLLVFAGGPLTNTFYGFILMGQMAEAIENPANIDKVLLYIGYGLFSALAISISGITQGKVGAYIADALGETGKGFANYIAIFGLCETVALFSMVLTMTSL